MKIRSTRRTFLKSSGILALGSSLDPGALLAAGPAEEVIDVHQHVNFHGRFDKQLVDHQRKMGVTRTVLLPSGSAIARASTHEGRSDGLAARVHPTEAAILLSERFPRSFIWFCNEVPDLPNARERIEGYLKEGAAGIGESKFNIDCTSVHMEMMAELAADYGVPILIHFQHNKYNTGFENFHKILEKFPKANFIGHAQTWWGNIDKNHVQKEMYPKTPVTPGGTTDRYLSDYPNMFGDFSAGSGLNSIARDEDHAVEFIARHQDQLLYGSDCADIAGAGDKCSGSKTLALLRKLAPDETVLRKILSGNARRIIRFD
ncbi:MAG: amidohydrolase family protein [Verrucomicrobiales bacterium]